jgi:hypothetical protein
MESSITVSDNVLPENEFEFLKNTIESPYFPWFFKPGIDYANDGKSQFTHNIYDDGKENSSVFQYMLPLLEFLGAKELIRIKANLLVKTNKVEENSLHIDYENCKTAVYYVNTNNGYTFFEDGQRIKSVSNRLVRFDSNTLHGGTSCSDELCRIVINFNYIV